MAVQPMLYEHLFLIGELGLSDEAKVRDVCSLSDLRGVPLVLPGLAHELRLMLERAFAQQGVEANTVADIDSLSTMVSAARDGVACTILPASALLSVEGADRVLRARRIVSPEIKRPISLCWLEAAPRSPAATVVQKLVVSLVPQLVADGRWPGVIVRRDGHAMKG